MAKVHAPTKKKSEKPKRAGSRGAASEGVKESGAGSPRPKPKGRPRGSKNVQRDECDVVASRCKRCGSSLRKPYQSDPTTLAAGGVDPITGANYTHVIWRRTACKQCGQARIDKCYELRETPGDQQTDAA